MPAMAKLALICLLGLASVVALAAAAAFPDHHADLTTPPAVALDAARDAAAATRTRREDAAAPIAVLRPKRKDDKWTCDANKCTQACKSQYGWKYLGLVDGKCEHWSGNYCRCYDTAFHRKLN